MNISNMPGKQKLANFGFNRYSQFGEDGIIEKIFSVIGIGSKTCVEFGAWDGFHLANTANLWTQGWRGILIEGDRRRFRDLEINTRKYGCICINAYVSADGPNRLEALLEAAGIKETVDLLSIDIDGDDYYIFDSLTALRPRVVVCEYNPTIPANIDLAAEPGSNLGSSVSALMRLARSKGYELVAVTQTNCFFVLCHEAVKLELFEIHFDKIKCDDNLNFLITSYSGDYVISGPLPYGFNFPYRGKLVGPHKKVAARWALLRGWAEGVRFAKRAIRTILGHC